MKKFKYVFIFIVALLFVPTVVMANSDNKKPLDEDFEVIEQKIKFIKTVYYYENAELDSYGNIKNYKNSSSEEFEVTKEEYDNADLSKSFVTQGSTTINTTYKMMTASLLYDSSTGTYRYKNQLNWKSFPSVRSYDIIAIGHYGTVAPTSGTIYFSMNYITASGNVYNSNFYWGQTFTYGSSATFKLPIENLSSLTITYYFDVHKTTNNTVTSQGIFGDYAHGTDSSLTLTQALNHVVNQSFGIVHDSSVASKFDTMSVAAVYWSGSW